MDTQNKTQREIKFRLRAANKVVGYEMWVVPQGEMGRWVYSYKDMAFNLGIPPIPHTEKDEYTGLKDKNGKEIYGGDIVQRMGYNYEVYWHTFTACWRLRGVNVGSGTTGITKGDMALMCEVIGNIYENPQEQ